MEWFVYTPFSMELGCEHLETVEETAKWYSSEGLRSPQGLASTFNRAWTEAQVAAREAGWDGRAKGSALVFWVPSDSGFMHGFAWRQADGTGILVSPLELPLLERHLRSRVSAGSPAGQHTSIGRGQSSGGTGAATSANAAHPLKVGNQCH